jgi:hypothetical protein
VENSVNKDGMKTWGNQQSTVQTGGEATPADNIGKLPWIRYAIDPIQALGVNATTGLPLITMPIVDNIELEEEYRLEEHLKTTMELVSHNKRIVANVVSNQTETLLLIASLPFGMIFWKMKLKRVPMIVRWSKSQESLGTKQLPALSLKRSHPAIPI